MRYVIIGNSAAAVGAVEGIRQKDREGSITIVSSEPHHTYSRPLISYLLLGKTTTEKMKYRPDDFYVKNGCTLMAGRRAEKINPTEKTVVLDGGESLSYDKLMVATGSTPFTPPIQGLDGVSKKFTFMTLDDAFELEKAIFPTARVLVMGAGLIGLKCAEGIYGKVGSITVVDLAPTILSSILDAEGSAMIQKHIESKGISFILSDAVQSFDGDKAVLKSGREEEFDILICAVGVRPSVSLIKDAVGAVNRGVVVNERLETSLPDVYAAGDCSEGCDISCGINRVLALLPNAYMQGECAGINMAGGECVFDKAIPMNAIGFFGLHMITAGSYTGDTYTCTSNGYKKLFYQDDLLKGYILIECVEKAGIYTNLIRERTPLSSIDFELICERPGLMAFGRESRSRTLGGLKK
ncbi:MAG: NAD(P)/FAD-dependent oxidoreductase [Eubacteriales bacterium]